MTVEVVPMIEAEAHRMIEATTTRKALPAGTPVVWPEGWRVEFAPLPDDLRGLTYFRERRSVISPNLHPWQTRATIMHEAIHAQDGPFPRHMEEQEERRVNREVARWLIPLEQFIEALRTSGASHGAPSDRAFKIAGPEVAAQFEVPVALFWSRIKGLNPSERHAVRAALCGTAGGDFWSPLWSRRWQ